MIDLLTDSIKVKWAEGWQQFSDLAACGPVSCLHLHPVLAKNCWLEFMQFKALNFGSSDKENKCERILRIVDEILLFFYSTKGRVSVSVTLVCMGVFRT